VAAVALTNVGSGPRSTGGSTVAAQPGVAPLTPAASARPGVATQSAGRPPSAAPAVDTATPRQETGVLLRDPVVSRVQPAAGPLAGGTPVTLVGRHLDHVGQVMFGGVPASSFVIVSPRRISAVAPATTSAGAVPIMVTPSGDTAPGACGGGCVARFAYLAVPTITRLTPPVGPLAGGTAVTVHGSGFAPGIEVYFGSFRVSGVEYVNGNTLRITAPPEQLLESSASVARPTRFPVSLMVKTPGGVSRPGPASRFTYL
jgi:hypothetical protein